MKKPQTSIDKCRINRTIGVMREVAKDAQIWMDDLYSTMQLSSDKNRIDYMMKSKQYDHVIDERLFRLSKEKVRDDLLEATYRIGPSKIWKQDHKSFMSEIDSVISSVAQDRS